MLRWSQWSEEQTDRNIPPLMSSCAPLTALVTLTCILSRFCGWADSVFAWGLGHRSLKFMTRIGFFMESEGHLECWGRSGVGLYPVDQIGVELHV